MISIILPVYNQQDIISQVLDSIVKNCSSLVNEIVVIIDGCTDESEQVIESYISTVSKPIDFNILHTDNIFEVKADNVGLKASTQPYCMLIQDDCMPDELGYDVRLLKPILVWNDVFAVGGRMGLDAYLKDDGHLGYSSGVSWTNLPRNIFAVRDVVNRGPIMLRRSMVESLGWLDENYAPLALDECDISMRAWIQHRWITGCYNIKQIEHNEWGTTRKNLKSKSIQSASELKNTRMFENKYREELMKPRHSENRIIE